MNSQQAVVAAACDRVSPSLGDWVRLRFERDGWTAEQVVLVLERASNNTRRAHHG